MRDVERAVEMLALSLSVLAKIKTTLEHLKEFWNMQLIECEFLKTNSEKQIRDLTKRKNDETKSDLVLRRNIKKAITNWMTLFKLNSTAYLSIKASRDIIDRAVCNFGQVDGKTLLMRTDVEIHEEMKKLLSEYNNSTENIASIKSTPTEKEILDE